MEDFVSRSDALGGPDAAPTQDYWRHVECVVPGWLRATARNFDPLSDGYFDVQEQLYASIAGKPYLGLASELTEFDKESAVRSLTAYPGRTLKAGCLPVISDKVAYLVIGTHSRQIESRIIDTLLEASWKLEIERPAILDLARDSPQITVDGVQGWRNPKLC